MNTKFEAKGVLLRHYETMGTNATEPFKVIVMDSKQAVLDHVTSLMVDNIKACGIILTTLSKVEDEDEMYLNKDVSFQCIGTLTELECEKLKELCNDIK